MVYPVIESGPLAYQLLKLVGQAHFEQVHDFGPCEDACPGAAFCPTTAPVIEHLPNVDIAVIEFDRSGKPVDIANVLLSRDYPQGVIVPIGPDYGTSAVRFRRWDIERWNGGRYDCQTGKLVASKGWRDNPALDQTDDIVPNQKSAPLEFMSPYPASSFKLLVAFYFLRLVERGRVKLDQEYSYAEAAGKPPVSRPLNDWLYPMITVSDNFSTCALIKFLWELAEIEGINNEFKRLGLSTLQINGTNPANGKGWNPGQIHMTALDTARLLWLIEGGPDVLWQQPNCPPVTAAELSDTSRRYLKKLLAEQALNECLSTANLYGAPHIQPGIPALVHEAWVSEEDGRVRVAGVDFGRDVRPANAKAEVTFLHKTGLTYNYASNIGIVRSLPGKPFRHYIIAFFANLGYRYVDPVFAGRSSLPAFDDPGPVCYTQRIAALAKQLDDWMVKKA